MDPRTVATFANAAGIAIPDDHLQGVTDTLVTTMDMAARVMEAGSTLPEAANAPLFDAWAGEKR